MSRKLLGFLFLSEGDLSISEKIDLLVPLTSNELSALEPTEFVKDVAAIKAEDSELSSQQDGSSALD